MSASTRAIALVQLIANPQVASEVQGLSQELQVIQSSPEGWQVADAMLNDNDSTVRFYGALTLQIKLNKEVSSLSDEVSVEILNRILVWLVQLTCQGERRLVLDKLCSTLTTYFIQSPIEWSQAIRQLVCSLYAERVIPTDGLHILHSTQRLMLMGVLSVEKQLILVKFCQILAEDMYTWSSMSQQHPHLSETFRTNTAEAADLLGACLVTSPESHVQIQVEALTCFTAWIAYAHNNWMSDPDTVDLLQDLTLNAAEHLLSPIEELREPAVELFVSILEYRQKFLRPAHLHHISQLVRRRIGPQCVMACRNDQQGPEIVAMGKLVAAYGKVAIKDIVAVRGKDSSNEIVELFESLLTGTGYPAEDDELILSATEFWNEYAEAVVDTIVDSEGDTLDSWLPPIRDDLLRALQSYLPRLAPPSKETLDTWDEQSFALWKFFRANVGDFLESVTNVPGTHLLQNLVAYAMQVLSQKDWLKLEAILYCINSVAESVNISDESTALNTIMGSSIFNAISDNSLNVPVVLRRAVLQMVDNFSSFIRSNTGYIPAVLTFLFTVLASSPAKDFKVADAAAKSFESLCSSCRKALTRHLDELLQQCPRALSGPSANAYQKEKVMAALASIIQALPSDEAQAAPLLSLIEVIETDLNTAVQLINAGNVEDGEILGIASIQCLANIGKGIQAPDDVIYDLESDGEGTASNPPSSYRFWTHEAGAPVQARILACFSILDFLPNPGDAIDAACTVLKSGLAETSPGPFVFPPSATVSFISKARFSTPRIEAILSTACTFVSSASRRTSPHLFNEVLTVYRPVANVLVELGDPKNDPQLAQLCIDFLQRLLHAYLDVLLAPSDEEIQFVLGFTINCLTSEAPMLKRNVCNFFETIIGLARPNNPTPTTATRVPIATVITHFSPLLARALLSQICGQAQRSELDSLCKPLRAFVFGIPNAKIYLEEALLSGPDIEESSGGDGGGMVDDEGGEEAGRKGVVTKMDKEVFLKKIVACRGSRQTNVVVKEFWVRCKGTVSRFE